MTNSDIKMLSSYYGVKAKDIANDHVDILYAFMNSELSRDEVYYKLVAAGMKSHVAEYISNN